VPTIVAGPTSLANGQSESNLNIFYTNSPSPGDWLSSQDDALWNSGDSTSPKKSTYDPCPTGWRVPTNSELSRLQSNKSSWTTNDSQEGFWFSGNTPYSESAPCVFLPATGYRDTDGSATSRGDSGYYWSSKTNNTYAQHLNFYSGGGGLGSWGRAKGCAVRCVRE
jgi:uncharacterized protein (TIGR02145 family)